MSTRTLSHAMGEAKIERLVMAAEEGAEIVTAVTKMQRHGEFSFHPNDDSRTPNVEHLRQEIIDNLAMAQVLLNHGDIKPITIAEINQRMADKLRYTHHQKEPQRWSITTTGLLTKPAQ